MFLNVLDVWDVRLEISVVSTHVNLAREKQEMENLSVHWFGLTDLNKTIGKMCSRKNIKTLIGDEILPLSLNTLFFFNYCMWRFFFGLIHMHTCL